MGAVEDFCKLWVNSLFLNAIDADLPVETLDSLNGIRNFRRDTTNGQLALLRVMVPWVSLDLQYNRPEPLTRKSVNYLLNYRLQWGKPDTLSLLTSALDKSHAIANGDSRAVASPESSTDPTIVKDLPPLPPDAPEYFTVNTPAEYISIIQNDWPYSGIPTY